MSSEGHVLPDDIYATLTGVINEDMVRRVLAGFTPINAHSPTRVHLLMHSYGGSPGDGIFLHNFLSSLPYEVIAYNGGNIASAAVPFYLGARTRVTSDSASFMIHRITTSPPAGISVEALAGFVEGVAHDNARVEGILREKAHISPGSWAEYLKRDFHITAAEAVACGLAHRIGDFSPPLGAQVTQI